MFSILPVKKDSKLRISVNTEKTMNASKGEFKHLLLFSVWMGARSLDLNNLKCVLLFAYDWLRLPLAFLF